MGPPREVVELPPTAPPPPGPTAPIVRLPTRTGGGGACRGWQDLALEELGTLGLARRDQPATEANVWDYLVRVGVPLNTLRPQDIGAVSLVSEVKAPIPYRSVYLN